MKRGLPRPALLLKQNRPVTPAGRHRAATARPQQPERQSLEHVLEVSGPEQRPSPQ
jgi:hypothetical protein